MGGSLHASGRFIGGPLNKGLAASERAPNSTDADEVLLDFDPSAPDTARTFLRSFA